MTEVLRYEGDRDVTDEIDIAHLFGLVIPESTPPQTGMSNPIF
jgi:hypothetical protein